jgi:dephospho-CoA kinase
MRVAITGGICDGKTTVLAALSELGYPTVSADEIVDELYSEPAWLERLRAEFGDEIVSESQFNRKWAAAKAFSVPAFRRHLNRLIHPEVIKRILARLDGFGQRLSFAEMPLLIESATQGAFDRVWVVDAGSSERLRRLVERLGGDEAAARARLAAQLPTEAKKPFADRILRTDLALESVKILAARLALELA